jgi:hypothetical protein
MMVSMVCVIGSASLVSGSPAVNGSLSEKELHPNDYAGMLASRLKSTFNTSYINGRLELVYPIEYGGAYVDSSNNLHIVLSKYATNATIDSYRSIMSDPDVIFEIAEFPLSRLYEAQDAIGPAMGTFHIDEAGANEITNRLELHLENGTKQTEIVEYLNSRIANFDPSCIIFLGPNPVTAGVGELNTPMTTPEYNGGFLGTDIPVVYGATAVAIVAVTVALACYLAFVRHAPKPQAITDT